METILSQAKRPGAAANVRLVYEQIAANPCKSALVSFGGRFVATPACPRAAASGVASGSRLQKSSLSRFEQA